MAHEGFNVHEMERHRRCLDEDTMAPRHPRSRFVQTSCMNLLAMFDDSARKDVSGRNRD